MKTLVCYGDLVADLVMQIPRLPILPDQAQLATSLSVEPGGAGNTLITAARLGASCVALGAIGEDAHGVAVHTILQAEGIDMSFAQRGLGSTNVLVLVFIDDAGQHVFIAHDGTGPAFQINVRERTLIEQGGVFFVPGYALAEGRMAAAAMPALMCAVEAGVPVMNDLGPIVADPNSRVREAAIEVIRHSLVTFLTEDEAMRFIGVANPDVAAQALMAMGSAYVLLKRGGNGCAVYSAESRVEIAGIQVVVKDTTAAGDSFAGGFMAHWLAHGDVLAAAYYANVVGATKVQKIGSGRQCPTRDEVAAMLAQFEWKRK